jgi:hypothetical protein
MLNVSMITSVKSGMLYQGRPPYLWSAPADERFLEMIYALTRLENGKVPSLRNQSQKHVISPSRIFGKSFRL